MFTGIIEEVGKIKTIRNGEKPSRIIMKASLVLENTIVGESISTNGVCLTITKINKKNSEVDIMAETVRMSNLRDLKSGNYVI